MTNLYFLAFSSVLIYLISYKLHNFSIEYVKLSHVSPSSVSIELNTFSANETTNHECRDLVMCRKQPGIAIGRLCDKCDGKCPVCDSYVRPTTLVRICDECSFGNYQNKCAVCGGEVCFQIPTTLNNNEPLIYISHRGFQTHSTASSVHGQRKIVMVVPRSSIQDHRGLIYSIKRKTSEIINASLAPQMLNQDNDLADKLI